VLQPEDPGLDALEYAGRLLYHNDLDGVRRLVRTHVSFAPGGAVHGLRGWIEHYVDTHAAYKGMRPIGAPPFRFRLYGIGTMLLGERDYDEQTKSHVVTQYFTFFFVPLFPVANYRVREESNRARVFLGSVPLRSVQKAHVGGVIGLILLLLILAGSSGSSSSERDATSDDSTALARADTTMRVTRYAGEMSDTTQSPTPVRSQMLLTFANLRTSNTGYLMVLPPLTGTGPYALRARRDSVRLTTLAGADTIFFIAERMGGNILVGRYGITGPGVVSKRYGTWRMHLVRGDPIPRELNPW
jgi:hypothetical protein